MQFSKLTEIINLKLPLVLAFLCFSYFARSQYKLEIEIVNLRSNNGKIALELLDNNQKVILGKKCIIQNKKGVIIIDNLKTEKYAIHFIHDENSNDKFDTNWLGIPIEGYGFSNNAFGNYGPLPFDKLLFKVKGDIRIILTTKY